MAEDSSNELTRALMEVRRGSQSAVEVLLPLVYDELRALAASFFRGQLADQTLQPTALVNEVYLKLAGSTLTEWQSRAHFMAVAAMAMRNILADHARSRKTAKRGGDWSQITLSGLSTSPAETGVDLLALDAALCRLAEIDPQQERVVELRFLAGLSVKETAHVLEVSERTVEREWRWARAWLRRELSQENRV